MKGDGFYLLADFCCGNETWRQYVLEAENLAGAEKEAVSKRMVSPWDFRYIFLDGKVVKTLTGPDLDGVSLEFAIGYFQRSEPVWSNPSQGDAEHKI